jgi:hypothetical protein
MSEYGYSPHGIRMSFLLEALGSASLLTRIVIRLAKHFFKLLRSGVECLIVLVVMGLWVPERAQPSRSRPLFMPISARTCSLDEASLARANALLDTLSEHIDILHADYYDVGDLVKLNERRICMDLNV